MRLQKFAGILQEALTLPQGEWANFFADHLQIPMDKAEELAVRVQKKYCQNNGEQESELPSTVLKSDKHELASKSSVYPVDSLSEKEFERFMKWLFGELGYETQSANVVNFGVYFVAIKEGRRVLVQACNYPKSYLVSKLAVQLSQQAKQACSCGECILVSVEFSDQAKAAALEAGVELWDSATLDLKISQIRKKANRPERHSFPPFQGSLLQSLLALAKTKDFTVESRAGGKYDLFLAGLKYPLLTFQGDCEVVTGCVFRIKYNVPVGEAEGEMLIRCGADRATGGPDDATAYELIIKYLEEFLE